MYTILRCNIHSGLYFANDVIEVGVTCVRGTFVCVLCVYRGVSKSLRHGECNVVIKKVTTHKSYFNGTGAQAGGGVQCAVYTIIRGNIHSIT